MTTSTLSSVLSSIARRHAGNPALAAALVGGILDLRARAAADTSAPAPYVRIVCNNALTAVR